MLALVLALAVAQAAALTYCGTRLCGHTNDHTFCQYQASNYASFVIRSPDIGYISNTNFYLSVSPLAEEGPGPNCVGYIEARLSEEEATRVLERLNQRRAAAAAGRLRALPPAGDMIKLRWIEELAREAQRWADQCAPPAAPEYHDACRDLFSVSVGQCVASVVGEAPGLRPESMVDMWYTQSMYYKGNVTAYEPSQKTSGYYGDFAQIMFANAFMVGCARSRFMSPRNGRLRSVERLVCNVAPRGPAAARALWTPAAPAAACPARARADADTPALCAFQYNLDESQDVENTMSVADHMLLNTVLNIERNETMNYLGSLDEIYLRNLAIVTMPEIQTTEIIKKFVTGIETTDLEKNTLDNLTISKIEEQVTVAAKVQDTVKLNRKVNLIGRPKSYNVDELNEVDSDHISENRIDVPRPADNHKYNVYYDYAEVNSEEIDEEALFSNNTDYNEVLPMSNQEKEHRIARTYVTNESSNYVAVTENKKIYQINYTEDANTKLNFSNSKKLNNITNLLMQATNDNASDVESKIEDLLLADPETAHQLQEELDRMENALSAPPPSVAGKVRRDLRVLPHDMSNATSDAVDLDKLKTADNIDVKEIEARTRDVREVDAPSENRTGHLAAPPMLDMVMKYMPYLKDYKNSVIRSSSNSPIVSFSTIVVAVFIVLCT